MLGLLAREAFFAASLDLRASFGNLLQTIFAPRQLVGYRHAVRNVRFIRSFGFGHEFGDFGLQLRLDLARMFIGKRAVPAGVGVDLGAVEPQSAQLQHAHLARQKQHLNEQPFDLLEESPPERRDGVVVGMIVGCDETKRHRVISRTLQLAARKYPRRVAINQNAQQHPRVVGRRTRAAINSAHRAKVHPVDHLHHKPRQMLLR